MKETGFGDQVSEGRDQSNGRAPGATITLAHLRHFELILPDPCSLSRRDDSLSSINLSDWRKIKNNPEDPVNPVKRFKKNSHSAYLPLFPLNKM